MEPSELMHKAEGAIVLPPSSGRSRALATQDKDYGGQAVLLRRPRPREVGALGLVMTCGSHQRWFSGRFRALGQTGISRTRTTTRTRTTRMRTRRGTRTRIAN